MATKLYTHISICFFLLLGSCWGNNLLPSPLPWKAGALLLYHENSDRLCITWNSISKHTQLMCCFSYFKNEIIEGHVLCKTLPTQEVRLSLNMYTCMMMFLFSLRAHLFHSEHLYTVRLSTNSQAAVSACSSSKTLRTVIMPSWPRALAQRVQFQSFSNCKS